MAEDEIDTFEEAWSKYMGDQAQVVLPPPEPETATEHLLNHQESIAFSRFFDNLLAQPSSPRQTARRLDEELQRLGDLGQTYPPYVSDALAASGLSAEANELYGRLNQNSHGEISPSEQIHHGDNQRDEQTQRDEHIQPAQQSQQSQQQQQQQQLQQFQQQQREQQQLQQQQQQQQQLQKLLQQAPFLNLSGLSGLNNLNNFGSLNHLNNLTNLTNLNNLNLNAGLFQLPAGMNNYSNFPLPSPDSQLAGNNMYQGLMPNYSYPSALAPQPAGGYSGIDPQVDPRFFNAPAYGARPNGTSSTLSRDVPNGSQVNGRPSPELDSGAPAAKRARSDEPTMAPGIRRARTQRGQAENRVNHMNSEKRRRAHIRELFDRMCSLVPRVAVAEEALPKSVVLQETLKRLLELESDNADLRRSLIERGVSTASIPPVLLEHS